MTGSDIIVSFMLDMGAAAPQIVGMSVNVFSPLCVVVLFWLIITTTKPPYSEPLKDLVNCTVTEIMESCTQCHYN